VNNLSAGDVRDSMPLFRSGCGGLSPTSALQLSINRCKVQRACKLNEVWHSRFPKIHWSNVVRNRDYVCFLAEYDDIAYASAIWSSPVAANRLKEGKTALELRRMAISDDAPKNTASRMIGIMRKIIKKEFPHITLLLSYQDTDVHEGTIYRASGWYPASKNKGTSWTNNVRQRNKEQSLSDKIRWEFRLQDSPLINKEKA
tara:strand:+ start:49 stop:651 length:603 start_codon:yes stop_codon:yes gene_type:complete